MLVKIIATMKVQSIPLSELQCFDELLWPTAKAFGLTAERFCTSHHNKCDQ